MSTQTDFNVGPINNLIERWFMPGPVSQSYDAPRDGVPPFPPHWAYAHLTDIEYDVLRREYERKHREEGVRDGKDQRQPRG